MFGWLDNIPWWRDLSYPTKGALMRAIKAALSVIVGILLTAALQGVLFPATWSPLIVIAITALLQAADKFIRETSIANAVAANDLAVGPETPSK
jgi:hypothetical protein